MEKLPCLQELGINAVEIMPVAEFPGDFSWGYDPSHPFAVKGIYGGPDALKQFVKAAHEHGTAIIVDVVYNHFGPTDLDLWQFDGWSEIKEEFTFTMIAARIHPGTRHAPIMAGVKCANTYAIML